MRNAIIVLVILAIAAGAVAHGKAEKSMGTVKSISATELVIAEKAGTEKSFQLTSNTRFLKSGGEAKATDLTVGERVVIEADVHHGTKAITITVKFGTPTHPHNH